MRGKRAKALRRYVASRVKAGVRRAYRQTKAGYTRYRVASTQPEVDRIHDARCRRREAFRKLKSGLGYWLHSPRQFPRGDAGWRRQRTGITA